MGFEKLTKNEQEAVREVCRHFGYDTEEYARNSYEANETTLSEYKGREYAHYLDVDGKEFAVWVDTLEEVSECVLSDVYPDE